jgi:dUTP pyrophosphatase
MNLKYTKTHPLGEILPHAHPTDAGLDLLSIEDITLLSGMPTKIRTGVSIEIPTGYVGLIWDKSSIGSLGIKTLGGVIDSDYRGEVIVTLINLTNSELSFPAKKKIAQLIIQKYESMEPFLVEKLEDSISRGDGGFGSTGA